MTELKFKSKEFVYNHHLAVPYRPLKVEKGKSIGEPRLDGNLIIHGDNLEALKSLMPLYADKVDCVFIDPPYNTGNEGWCYNDKVNSPMIKEWLKSNPINVDDGLRHDKWCAMMWPRLRLLHELLSEKGIIFVSIDDNEQHHLRMMMDEIFGAHNFFAVLTRRAMHTVRNSSKDFNLNADYILSYAKEKTWFEKDESRYIRHFKDKSGNYSHNDEDGRGQYKLDPIHARNYYEPYEYTFKNGVTWKPPKGSYPRYSVDTLKKLENDNCIVFSGEEPKAKRYLKDVQEGQPPDVVLDPEVAGFNAEGTRELRELFGEGGIFPQPKPTRLINFFLSIIRNKNALVLDSFAGSGTTAHAVLKTNKEDGGQRRFILIECEKDYADTVTAERIRRAIKGYAFQGEQTTELLREKVTWTRLKNANRLTETVEGIESQHGSEYDEIKKTVKDGELIVTGIKKVKKRTEGLGGEFTYCTLDAPLEIDKILTGKTLPPYESLGAVLFRMATREPLDPKSIREKKFYLGKANGQHIWMKYKPDLDWLKSTSAPLTLDWAREIAKTDPQAKHLVFASGRYVSQSVLDAENIPVEFVPFPYALYRIEPD